MSEMSRRLAALSPQKRALFEKALSDKGLLEKGLLDKALLDRGLLDEGLPDTGRREEVYPLSVLQEGMWFLEQLHPGNAAYRAVSAMRVEGPLRVDLLRRAVADISRRHDIARTTFELRDGRPVQVVSPRGAPDVVEVDLRGRSLDDAELERQAVAAVRAEPLDISTRPPLRLAVLRLPGNESVLAVAAHHLVFDRETFGLVLAELSALYDEYAQGAPAPRSAPAIQYGDFARWQCRQRELGRWDAQLAYWRDHLAGAPAALTLPTDRPRPAVQGFRGAQVPIEVPAEVMERLGALAREHGATPYMALLAAYAVVLQRHSGQDDIVVGVPASMRDLAETQTLLGYFINTLPVRVRLTGDPGFVELLDRVRVAALGAYDHQEVPFYAVVADLDVPRDTGRQAVCQTSFTYMEEPVPETGFGGARLSKLPVAGAGARYDVELQAYHRDGALTGCLEYDRDLFDEPTVARLAGHLRRAVEAVVESPREPVGRLDLMTAAERHWIVDEVNDTARDWPEDDGWIHQCVERQVRRTPDATALVFEGASLTYSELNRRANQLAHRLIRAGVGRDVPVGVAMERSPELVVGLLAVLKAGGAYTPLDPDLPAARLQFMLDDVAAPVVLTHRAVAGRLPAGGADVLCLDSLAGELRGEPSHDPGVDLGGEDLAYVIYTSGSTGRPKGVTNVHAGIRNRLLWMQDRFPLDATDRVLQKTPYSFDVSVWEFFWPLMAGATLVVARPGGHRDPGYLSRLIREQGITTVHFVPSMLHAFLAEPVGECTTLRRVICSGEALPRDLQDRFLAVSDAELHNLYGPTEAAVDVTHWPCRRDDPPGPVPIGRPIANTQVLVLDRFGRPAPVGVTGELYLGGRNLARGYLNRPELTAERFVAHPLGSGGRLYRTGDLARLRPDGAVLFLGRTDHQVKLRGFRIELGEIERVLTGVPGVREAVVVDRELRPGDVRLVAYLTVGPEAPQDLPGRLRALLPEYMVPSFFEVLDHLPLTPNGKVDRNALPGPTAAHDAPAAEFAPPAGETEDLVAGIWREVLGVERVGRHDSFFDLGGHSLLMARAGALLADRLGRDVPMVTLFQFPTVASLAAHLCGPAVAPDEDAREARERADTRRGSAARRRRSADRRSSNPTRR